MKRLLILVAALIGFATLATAQPVQQLNTDVIYTTDGRILQGTIVEQIPGVKYTITTLEGSTYTIDALKVERITREVVNAPYTLQNYNYSPYVSCKFDENGNPIFPLDPAEAMSRSAIFPGLGQLYNGEYLKGSLLIVGGVASLVGFALSAGSSDLLPNSWYDVVGWGSLALYAGSYLYALIDAPIVASRWNKKHGFSFNGDNYINVAPAVGIVIGENRPSMGMNISLTF
ncbi:MAG: hypothetical protein J6V28_05110 [Tidjanibacter sp.]|nr:hypothetical protein [Tidjanibacter sp.]